jgi:tRNA nucleotidyltransferase/poly(A) polymerase
LVGGAVREIFRNIFAGEEDTTKNIKDWDFAVAADSYDVMREYLVENGFEIYLETPQYFTIRARTPKDKFIFAGIDMTGKTFDFTLCRTESDYTDGRRPDLVRVGTIKQDLSRRDFTMNAIALDEDETVIDPFGGVQDIRAGVIRCVGSTDRLKEDSLRMLRAIRFSIQLGFELDDDVWAFLYSYVNAELLKNIDENRVRDELTKCFKANTWETLETLREFRFINAYVFKETDIWLMPTVKGK